MCNRGKCRRAEEIEGRDRNREMLKRKMQKRKRGRDNNAVRGFMACEEYKKEGGVVAS